jgi:hypothetical protein
MSNIYSNQGSSKPKDANHIHHETKDEERCEAVWDDLAGFVQYCDEHNMDDTQTACAVLFVEAIAEQMAHDKTTIGDVTFDLIAGHYHLNQFVSRRLLEQMEALEVIKPPTIMDRWTRKTKQQIARRALWDLGSTSKNSWISRISVATSESKGMRGHMRKRVTPVTNTATQTSRSCIDISYALESFSTVTSRGMMMSERMFGLVT